MNENDTVTTSMEKLGTFDYGALFFHLDNTMKNLSDTLHHTIEGIGTQISSLEDETCKIDNHVEDLKNFTEKYHGTTHMKLRKMHNVLQEVPIFTYLQSFSISNDSNDQILCLRYKMMSYFWKTNMK